MTAQEFLEKKIHLIDKELWMYIYDEMYFALDGPTAEEVVEILHATSCGDDAVRKNVLLDILDMEFVDWCKNHTNSMMFLAIVSGFRNWLGYSYFELVEIVQDNAARWEDILRIYYLDNHLFVEPLEK